MGNTKKGVEKMTRYVSIEWGLNTYGRIAVEKGDIGDVVAFVLLYGHKSFVQHMATFRAIFSLFYSYLNFGHDFKKYHENDINS